MYEDQCFVFEKRRTKVLYFRHSLHLFTFLKNYFRFICKMNRLEWCMFPERKKILSIWTEMKPYRWWNFRDRWSMAKKNTFLALFNSSFFKKKTFSISGFRFLGHIQYQSDTRKKIVLNSLYNDFTTRPTDRTLLIWIVKMHILDDKPLQCIQYFILRLKIKFLSLVL